MAKRDGERPNDAPVPGENKGRRSYYLQGGLKLVADSHWSETAGVLDPGLRLALSLIDNQDRIQLLDRTGIDLTPGAQLKQYLPLHVELSKAPDAQVQQYLAGQGLEVPQAYYDEAADNDELRTVTARILLEQAVAEGNSTSLRAKLFGLATDGFNKKIIKRISLANPLQPCFLGASMEDIDLPVGRQHNGVSVDGTGIVVGIIDDGCAFAHRDFLMPGTSKTRVVRLWDQAHSQIAPVGGWVPVNTFGYGCEISNVQLDNAIAAHVAASGVIDEDAVYYALEYPMPDRASHGTHVMGIAAGNGQSAMGFEGVAPKADIIFVQLPARAIEIGMAALSKLIADGAAYIFARAKAMGKPAVVNISYGGYAGPHDGTAPIETHLDQLLAKPNRAVVVSAGNGFEADCHAKGHVNLGAKSQQLGWVVHPFDPSLNFMQIWYNGNTALDVLITPPDGLTLPPVHLGTHQNIVLASSGDIVGFVDHQTDAGNQDHRIEITLRPTEADDPPVPGSVPAPSGLWSVQLENVGAHRARFHAWIERDDAGRPSGARRRQSHFVTAITSPEYTLTGLATGHRTIVVGGYNTATQEVCRYSACGPTRATAVHGSRPKPDVCAPAEEDAAGNGILSTSSRRAQATRMNGTSASAPFVAGLVALILQYHRDKKPTEPPLTAQEIRHKLKAAAHKGTLKQNRHQLADVTRLFKQKDVPWEDLIGAGKIDITDSL